jgi:N12 class adenine-specific DNA methylase
MAFNKKAHLLANTEAIRTAFTLDRERRRATEAETEILQQYSGFGGIKCILKSPGIKADWTKSELDLLPVVADLHRLIRENSKDEQEYKRYFNSLKSSILTAFYTPQEVIRAISDTLKENGVTPQRFLEPSAGNGAFADAFRQTFPQNETVCFEKDLLTGKILSHLHPDDKVHVKGFEEIENRSDNQFDVISSNIPFGDVSVFDASFLKSGDSVKRQSTRAIHNFFFVKGAETLHEGGLLAFITSQGVMNSPQNEPVRRWLMENTNLVSAVRLPNNLFTDHAGTEVGSDLIILQKNSGKVLQTTEEQAFVQSRKLSNGIAINNYFQNLDRVVHTKGYAGADPYGKPAMVFLHEGGIPAMATDLKKMLSEDFDKRLNKELYQDNAIQTKVQFTRYQPTKQDWEEMGEMIAATAERDMREFMNARPEDYEQKTRKSTHELDWEENSLGFDDLFSIEDFTDIQTHSKENTQQFTEEKDPPAKEKEKEKPETIRQEPVMSLYDLFGFSEEERKQLNIKKKSKNKAQSTQGKSVQLNLFAQPAQNTAQTVNRPTNPQTPQPTSPPALPIKPRPYSGSLQDFHKQGSMVVEQNGQLGFLQERYREDAVFKSLELNPLQEQKAKSYIQVRDAYHLLYNYEATEKVENKGLRESLNEHYDIFVKRYGYLNDRKNLDLIKMDAGGQEMLSLERVPSEGSFMGAYQKADIFTQPVAFNPNEITEVANSTEALSASLNKFGEVNTEYMLSLMPEKSREEMLEDLHERIYYNPLIRDYEISDRFIAGNVVEKAEALERFIKDNPEHEYRYETENSLKALKDAIPRPITFEELDFNFGERWIPQNIYSKYASCLFDVETNINYSATRDDFSVKAKYSNANIYDKYCVRGEFRKYDGLNLMTHALHNTTPNISKSMEVRDENGDIKTIKVRDGEKIQLANSKIDEIRNGFTDWLNGQSPEFKQRLSDLYNRKFNCFVRPQYDGSHQNFPDLDLKSLGIPGLYQSQKDAIWMLKMNNGGICDHEVGAGKTLIMCCGAYEMKRLGLANKPMIIGLKANVHEIAATFRKAYPNAKILYPGKEDFTPKNRQKIFNDIKNNSWDAVILTHDQFGKIPQSPEIQKQILEKELESVDENLQVLREQGKEVSGRMLKGVETRKENLEVKIKNLTEQIQNRTDDIVDFKLMGIDHIFVDESHRFKNLMFNTRHDRVAGLGNSEGSQRALNMLFALRTIQERTGKDLGATFLSGTTISNSLTELYLLFKYLRPQEMERQNINSFDAWAAVFAKKSTDYEFSVTNEIIQKERFRYFIPKYLKPIFF